MARGVDAGLFTSNDGRSCPPIANEILPSEPIKLSQGNLICNFRAPTLEEYLKHKDFCKVVKNDGLDVCRVLLGFEEAYLAAKKGAGNAVKLSQGQQVINLQMNNQFLYQVQKPRREPYSLNCIRGQYQRTISSSVFEAYVTEKARCLNREFSFRDFLELKHDAFRRIVIRLKRKGKIIANPLRTVPRFYYLAEKLSEYENNTVKLLFTNRGSAEAVLDIVRECISEEQFFKMQFKRLREECKVKVMAPIRI